jgi:hypothetical protein
MRKPTSQLAGIKYSFLVSYTIFSNTGIIESKTLHFSKKRFIFEKELFLLLKHLLLSVNKLSMPQMERIVR